MSAIKKERYFWIIFIAIMALLIMVIYLLDVVK
jgi:hypothetical protein